MLFDFFAVGMLLVIAFCSFVGMMALVAIFGVLNKAQKKLEVQGIRLD